MACMAGQPSVVSSVRQVPKEVFSCREPDGASAPLRARRRLAQRKRIDRARRPERSEASPRPFGRGSAQNPRLQCARATALERSGPVEHVQPPAPSPPARSRHPSEGCGRLLGAGQAGRETSPERTATGAADVAALVNHRLVETTARSCEPCLLYAGPQGRPGRRRCEGVRYRPAEPASGTATPCFLSQPATTRRRSSESLNGRSPASPSSPPVPRGGQEVACARSTWASSRIAHSPFP